jgi:hypothetical protein
MTSMKVFRKGETNSVRDTSYIPSLGAGIVVGGEGNDRANRSVRNLQTIISDVRFKANLDSNTKSSVVERNSSIIDR